MSLTQIFLAYIISGASGDWFFVRIKFSAQVVTYILSALLNHSDCDAIKIAAAHTLVSRHVPYITKVSGGNVVLQTVNCCLSTVGAAAGGGPRCCFGMSPATELLLQSFA